MSHPYANRYKHLTLDQRFDIQKFLNAGLSFKAIAKRIDKSPSTVSKEVRKHTRIRPSMVNQTHLLDPLKQKKTCPKLLKPPYVCNSCSKRSRICHFDKHLYEAKFAQTEYESLLTEDREGIPLTKEEFYMNDKVLSNGLKKGQHLYHIMATNNLSISKSTAYRHLHRGYLSASKFDFPRVLKFKQRKKRNRDFIPKAIKVGRTYDNFLAYRKEHNLSSWVEMDTVIGRIGGKAIVTFDFTFCNFMIGLLIDSKSSSSVTLVIESLKQYLLNNSLNFGDIFPILLTDNGGEFANVSVFENTLDGIKETSLFFCDPFRSCQKPRVEKNHTLFRDIVPKGSSFDEFTQDKVNLIFSHVNSVKRKALFGKSPFDIFSYVFNAFLAEKLGISEIPVEDVIQSPKLFREK